MFEYFQGRRLRCVVTGVSGFIGGHLGAELRRQGHHVVGADWEFPDADGVQLEESCDEFCLTDLRTYEGCRRLFEGAGPGDEVHVFHLAADMGGMGFIQSNHGVCILHNTLIDMHMLEAARAAACGVRFFYASSACAYPEYRQLSTEAAGLREIDAWPAQPQDAYGLEKLFCEEACRHYCDDYGLDVRIARFHNVYGPRGTWKGGREKAPAALCRKVAACREGEDVEVWSDGRQTRSFVFVDDLVEGVLRLMACDDPRVAGAALNLGSDHLISMNDLAKMVIDISGKRLGVRNDPDGPQGVRGRNSDNSLMREVLGWEPATRLRDGMARLYEWVAARVAAAPEDLDGLKRSVVTPTAAPKPL